MSSDQRDTTSQLRQIAVFGRHVLDQGRARTAAAFGFLFLGSLTEGVSILLLVPVLQLVGNERRFVVFDTPAWLSGWLGPRLQIGLAAALILVVALVLAQSLLLRFKNIYMAELLYDVINRLRVSLFESITKARWGLIGGLRGSDLNHALTADIDRIQSAAFHLMLLIQGLVVLAIYLCVSWLISPIMTIVAFVSGGAMFAALRPVRRGASSYGKLLTQNRKAQYRTVTEFLAGVKVAKSFNSEPLFLAELSSTLWHMRQDFVRYVRLNTMGSVLFQVASAFVLAGFVYAALRWLDLPLPKILVLVFVFMRVAPRFSGLQSDLQEVLTNLPAFDAVMRVQQACEREQEEFDSHPLPRLPLRREIRLDRVTFRHEGRPEDTLLDASLAIPAGSILAIIGPSGSGKTTLADVIMGLLEPLEGTVSVDGLELNRENRRRWRDSISYVPQEVFLLHDTVAANLRLGAPDASEAEIWDALRAANAEEFVAALPEGLQTVLGDRGLRISGGERQRLSLARALLRRPQLLILDEATSALDWEHQNLIAASIRALRGSMTVITIAHRLSMIAFADEVVALEGGRVVEAGDYATLSEDANSRLGRMARSERAGDASATGAAAADISR